MVRRLLVRAGVSGFGSLGAAAAATSADAAFTAASFASSSAICALQLPNIRMLVPIALLQCCKPRSQADQRRFLCSRLRHCAGEEGSA